MDHRYGPDLSGMEAGVYLRKSRMEEGQETSEVLARHRDALTALARERGIHIIETYPEIVSGGSLSARPQMLRLLDDVEAGRYQCVLCMDMDRLSRGSMRDQGIVLDTFKESGALIVTPDKVYDLADEVDEEFAEMKTFLSRREYKIITKRLRRGLMQSIAAGCYVANAPYGYRKVTVDRRPTLEIFEPEARFVRMMFELYVQGCGCVSVARQVNALGARPHRSDAFSRNSIAKILRNPVYIGKIVWDQKRHIKKGVRGSTKNVTIYRPREEWLITDGIHPAIVDRALYDRAQEIMAGRYYPSKRDGTVKSPLAGLVRCDVCGGHMQRLTCQPQPYLICQRPGCCCSAQFRLVEQQMISHLEAKLEEIRVSDDGPLPDRGIDALEVALEAVRKELASAMRQKARLYELLELGEYDVPTFRERMAVVQAKIASLERQEVEARQSMEAARDTDLSRLADQIEYVLGVYASSDAAGRNALLRSVVEVAWYHKEKKTKPNDFTLRLIFKRL